MDNLTHTLTAWALARAGLNRLAPYATPALIVSALLPDIDIVYALGGGVTYLAQHRGWTHSVFIAPALGALVGAAVWRLARRRHAQPHLLRNLMLVCALGALSHSLMDWTTAYGTQLLWPFTRRWFALDWVYIVDTWLLAMLVLGLALPALFRLISEEIGARRDPRSARRGAQAALAGYALLLLLRGTLHAQAIERLNSRVYGEHTAARVGAFPTPVNPWRWYGIAETAVSFEAVEIALPGEASGFEPTVRLFKPETSPMLEAARRTRTFQVFLDWARYPHVTVTPELEGWRVLVTDLRYGGYGARPPVFTAWVELDRANQVRAERYGFGLRGEPPPD